MYSYSPLRYPGGKARVSNYIRLVCLMNGLRSGVYAEPYAGGASVALALLMNGDVSDVHINDIDPGIAAFWKAVMLDTERLCQMVMDVDLSVDEWRRQRSIYRSDGADNFELGFATLFLNRTNRSGIIGGGGVIGGLAQAGTWKMDARFPRDEIVRRIRRIASFGDKVQVSNLDAITFIRQTEMMQNGKVLYYLDPPYYVKGRGLYTNYYKHTDHAAVAEVVHTLKGPWLVSYDNVEPICGLYEASRKLVYDIRYSARARHTGSEVMFYSDEIEIPDVENPAGIDGETFDRLVARLR